MKKVLLGLALLIIIALGAYVALRPSAATAPAPTAQVNTHAAATPTETNTIQKPPADTGAGGVYDPNAPAGSAAECAACGQYSGSQKAQCLAALNCQ